MLRLSKVCVRGIPIGLTLVALALAGGITNVQATPTCSSTVPRPTGGTLLFSQIPTGTCVQVGDKLFGDFSFGNLPAEGSVTFAVRPNGASATISTNFAPNTTYNNSFEVEANTGTTSITELLADFAQTTGGPTMLVQTTTPAPSSGEINLTKEGDIITGPNQLSFMAGVTDLRVASTFMTGPGSDASAILNTIVETTLVPEPATLELLGIALTGFGAYKLRRKS